MAAGWRVRASRNCCSNEFWRVIEAALTPVKLAWAALPCVARVRVPVINFLRACPLPEAKERIEELKKIDPESVQRASQFFPLGAATPPAGSQRPKKDDAAGGLAPPVPKKDKQSSNDEPSWRTMASPARCARKSSSGPTL